jgi:hypothetical protein
MVLCQNYHPSYTRRGAFPAEMQRRREGACNIVAKYFFLGDLGVLCGEKTFPAETQRKKTIKR